MNNPKKTSASTDKEEDEEESPPNSEAVRTTSTTIAVTPPTRSRRAVQVRPGSGGSRRSKSSDVKGGSSSSSSGTGKQKRRSGKMDAPMGEPRCPICGSRFGSWKGYFGHLRVHKRTWSGAFPPPIWEEKPSPDKAIVDEQFQDYLASELCRIGHETLHKMRQEESSSSASSMRASNMVIDLNVEPEVGGHQTGDFDLNLPPSQRNDDGDDNGDEKKEDAPAS